MFLERLIQANFVYPHAHFLCVAYLNVYRMRFNTGLQIQRVRGYSHSLTFLLFNGKGFSAETCRLYTLFQKISPHETATAK
jgi:hypothetical protein